MPFNRAAVARAIVAAGLIPSLGVFHKNRSNAFCLADDLLEPYRPLVDWRVKVLSASGDAPKLEERATRAALLSLFNEGLRIGDRNLPLLAAIEASAVSLATALTGGPLNLCLPKGLPLSHANVEGEEA